MLQTLQPIFDFDPYLPTARPGRHKKKRSAVERAFLAVDYLRRFPGLTQAEAARLANSNGVYVHYALKASAADREAILSGDKPLIPPRVPTNRDLERIVAVADVLKRIVAVAGAERVWNELAKNL